MVKILFSWILLLATPVAAGVAGAHPLYVSVTEMEYNAAEKSLEITSRIFIDDFEKTLAKAYNTKVDLIGNEFKNTPTLITDYVKKHLQLSADGKTLALTYVGHEFQKGACWCYFEVKEMTTAPKKMQVVTDLLHDFNEKQMNLLHVTVNGTRKSTKLNCPEKNASFEF
jgi:hypothetical protein